MVARELPDFVAEIDLLPTEAGVRQTALTGGEWRTIWRADVWLLMRDVALPMFVVAKTFEHPTQGADGTGRKMDCASSLSGSASCHIALPEKTLAKRKGRHFARSGNRLPYGLWPTGDLSSVAAMS